LLAQAVAFLLQQQQQLGRQSAVRARSTNSSASGVNTTCLPAVRSRIGASSWRSSVMMPAESVDWVTAQAKAARPKCRVSASATR
jgi:hypothetical protein